MENNLKLNSESFYDANKKGKIISKYIRLNNPSKDNSKASKLAFGSVEKKNSNNKNEQKIKNYTVDNTPRPKYDNNQKLGDLYEKIKNYNSFKPRNNNSNINHLEKLLRTIGPKTLSSDNFFREKTKSKSNIYSKNNNLNEDTTTNGKIIKRVIVQKNRNPKLDYNYLLKNSIYDKKFKKDEDIFSKNNTECNSDTKKIILSKTHANFFSDIININNKIKNSSSNTCLNSNHLKNKLSMDDYNNAKNLKCVNNKNNNDNFLRKSLNSDYPQSFSNQNDIKITGENENADYKNKTYGFTYDIDKTQIKKNDYKNDINTKILINKLIIKMDYIYFSFYKFNLNLKNYKEVPLSIYELTKKTLEKQCEEVFLQYFNSSLIGIIPSFFSVNNKIIIQSAINLCFFIILLIFYISQEQRVINIYINKLAEILTLLKDTLILIVKHIEIYYDQNINIEVNNKKYLSEQNIIDLVNSNCRSIVRNITQILCNNLVKSFERYDNILYIFNNLTAIDENNIYKYFNDYLNNSNQKNEFNYDNSSKLKRNLTSREKVNNKKKETYYENNKYNKFNKIKNNNLLNSASDNNVILNDKNNFVFNNFSPKSPQESEIELEKNKILSLKNSINSLNSQKIILIEENKTPEPIPPFLHLNSTKPYTLVFNLNETLIANKIEPNTNILKILLRPGLFHLLSALKPLYELILFSNEKRETVEPIINKIEKLNNNNQYFDFYLFKEHCILKDGEYIKDLSLFGRDLKKIVLIDSDEQQMLFSKENCIKISKYTGDNDKDNVLLELLKILKIIHDQGLDDIRDSLKNYFSDD